MEPTGLRERKKEKTRQHIADSAARLFAERGYEQVAVIDVAREADVSEQTIYNYFATKEQLVTDREPLVREKLAELIQSRPSNVSPAEAIRGYALDFVDDIRRIPKELWKGELGNLSAISPTVHRIVLEMTDRRGFEITSDICATTSMKPEIARIHGMALANALQFIITEAGHRTQKGQSQKQIAEELKPAAANIFDELDQWFKRSMELSRGKASETRRR